MSGGRFRLVSRAVLLAVCVAAAVGLVLLFRGGPLSDGEMRRLIQQARRELSSGNAAQALNTLQPALNSPHTPGVAWEIAGRAHSALKQFSSATDALRRISQDDEAWNSTRFLLAQTLLQDADWDGALDVLGAQARHKPDDLPALDELRWLYFNLLRNRDALAVLHLRLSL